MRPPLVARAEAAGLEPWPDETGALLHVLAGMRGRARVAAVDAGSALAWIVSALDPAVAVFAVERAERTARDVFEGDAGVTLLPGDWRSALEPHAPFDLIFHPRPVEAAEAVPLLAPRGLVVSVGAPETWRVLPDVAAAAAGPLTLAVRTR